MKNGRSTINLCMIAAAVICLSLVLASCGSKEDNTEAVTDTQTNTDAVADEGADVCSVAEVMKAALGDFPDTYTYNSDSPDAAVYFESISDTDYSLIEKYCLICASDGSACEIIVIKVKDEKDADTVRGSLEEHLQKRITLYKDYQPEDIPTAESTQITQNGKYVAFAMGNNPGAAVAAFKDEITSK